MNAASPRAGVAALPLLAGLRPFEDHWPHGWSFRWQVLASVVLFDLGITMAHWASHRARSYLLKWAGVGDVNFGLLTNSWDRMLGAWSFDPKRRFTSNDLGIGKEPNFPDGYLPQLLSPFRRSSP